MTMRYVFKEPNYDQSTKVYSELAAFLNTYTSKEDRLLVNDDGLRVLKNLASYQYGGDHGCVRVRDGFTFLALDKTQTVAIVKELVEPTLVEKMLADGLGFDGYFVEVERATRSSAPKITKKVKAKKTKK